jgi:hypothetical protein
MLLREIKSTDFIIFTANVQVRNRFYSQTIPVNISARSTQEARKMLQAQYGSDSIISGLRRLK